MIFNNSRLLLLALSLILVALFAVLAFGIYSIRVKDRKTSELLNLADHNAEVGKLARSVRTIQSNAAEDIRAFDSLVLNSDKLVPLIENLEETGRVLGLSTNILSVEKTEDKESPEPDIIRIIIEAQGSWAKTIFFLRAIESLPYRTMIEGSNLSKVEIGWRSKIILSLHSFN